MHTKFTDNKLNLISINEKSNIKIPYAQDLISAGFPSSAENFIEKALSLDELMIKHPSTTFFVRVIGDSMKPLINSNDILIVDRSLSISNNKICIARINDEFMVKRIRLVGQKIFLIAENDLYKPIEIKEDMDFEAWGIVTFIIHQT